MNIKSTFFFLLFFVSFGFFLSACEKNTEDLKGTEDQFGHAFVSEDPLFDCNFKSIDSPSRTPVRAVHIFNNYAFFGRSNLHIIDVATNEILMDTGTSTYDFVLKNKKVFVCSADGIFSFHSETTEFKQEANVGCKEMVLTTDDELIFLSLYPTKNKRARKKA
ncbi:MAG: hypothetical protein AAGI23_17405 [Bacteroidota bacterium]